MKEKGERIQGSWDEGKLIRKEEFWVLEKTLLDVSNSQPKGNSGVSEGRYLETVREQVTPDSQA